MVIYSFVALVVVLTNLENVIGKGFHFSEMKQNDLEEMFPRKRKKFTACECGGQTDETDA